MQHGEGCHGLLGGGRVQLNQAPYDGEQRPVAEQPEGDVGEADRRARHSDRGACLPQQRREPQPHRHVERRQGHDHREARDMPTGMIGNERQLPGGIRFRRRGA